MKLNELYTAIKQLNPGTYYLLNEYRSDTTYILEYDRKKQVWVYYFLDERGGKSEMRTFATEEEACDYAYKDAVRIINIFREAYAKLEEESGHDKGKSH